MDTDVSHETEKRLTSIEERLANLEGDKPGDKPEDEPDTEEETPEEETEQEEEDI